MGVSVVKGEYGEWKCCEPDAFRKYILALEILSEHRSHKKALGFGCLELALYGIRELA